jgi:hypothetical protein
MNSSILRIFFVAYLTSLYGSFTVIENSAPFFSDVTKKRALKFLIYLYICIEYIIFIEIKFMFYRLRVCLFTNIF